MSRRFTASRPLAVSVLLLALTLAPESVGGGTPPVYAASYLVTTLADSGPGSLRQAILDANAAPGADTITFALSGTIVLATALPDVTDPAGLTIDGSGQSVAVSGNSTVRPFSTETGASLSLHHLTITKGGNGGVRNRGTLFVTSSMIVGNPGSLGGGIRNEGGAVTVTNSTISGNGAALGGGISTSGTLTVANSTISGNTATAGGGGIYGSGSVLLVNSSIIDNRAGLTTGGVNILSGTLTLTNSIVAANTAPMNPDCSGSITAGGPNLVGDPSGCTITGTPPITGDPKLGPLADNGGPTQTHALLLGSPAIDAGDDAVCAAAPVSGKDQRGVARPQGAHCDLGAFELEAAATIGGKNLRITTGSIDLSWDGGTAQTGYTLLQYNANAGTSTLVPLSAVVTSYSHAAAVPGAMYCYALAATGAGDVVLALSDLLCAMTGLEQGTAVPQDFALGLNQSATATLTWAPPSGGADSYLLARLPLDGTLPSQAPLSGGTTSITQATVPAGMCFELVAYKGNGLGTSDVLCGIPGFSTLGFGPGRRTATDVMAGIAERLAGRPLVLAESPR